MNLERYSYLTTNNYHNYTFYSEGPRGRIKKTVTYLKIFDDPVAYNLAFGDEDYKTGVINDAVVTDNKDLDLVLATVAATVVEFSERFGNHYIYATGSTLSRTRLYQMGIAKFLDEISKDFEIYGYNNGSWHEFQRNTNYEALLVKRK